MDIEAIERRCINSVFDILELHGVGHAGGSLSVLQILISLYFQVCRIDPDDQRWPDRDRIVLSKAHATEGMYAVLAEKGFFSKEKFSEYLKFGSDLQGHVEITTPGVEYSGGALGQGVTFACALAYVGKMRNKNYKVFAVLGDGECHEGSVWEAAMFGSHYKLDNLYVLIDHNHYADHGNVDELMNLQPLDQRWRSFGWETKKVQNGNSVKDVTATINSFHEPDKPKCLNAK